jgi:hypothetical protein
MSQKIIHYRIAKTAKALAAAAYEELAKIDAFYRAHRSMAHYVRKNWRHYIPYARQSLVGILAKDFSHDIALGSYTAQGVDAMKAEVYECLLLDGGFKAPAEAPLPG